MLLADAEYAVLPAGHTLARQAEPIADVYFPETGLIVWITGMTTGHQVAVASVGAEGLIGASAVLAVPRHPYRVVVLVESSGYRLPSDVFRRLFDRCESLRAAVLAHTGRQLIELGSLAACSRVHSHRQRLARWLLMMTDKTGQRVLPVTHDVLAQVVGGPRHAVTVALNELRRKGAVASLRGKIEVLNRRVLAACACECHRIHASLVRSNAAD